MLISVDAGRSYVKVVFQTKPGIFKTFLFPSWITKYYETDWDVLTGENDYVIEHEGEANYIGEVVEFVADGDSGRRMDEDKGSKNTLLFILAALYRAGVNQYEPVDLVTGVPLGRFNSDMEKVKEMLEGSHKVTMYTKHGKEMRTININRCAVTVEGAGAFFDQATEEETHVIDLGSRTVNCLTFRRKKFLAPASLTLPWGWDTLKEENRNYERVAETLHGELSAKWHTDARIIVVGGQAEQLTPAIREYFPYASTVDAPQFANARGYYKIGKVMFGY
ncbi:ParM/StbA family protein [Paenactinomyces guangxiensis]|uniref:ParM/StbA family protein n=1 Tax=Paenactinomyces guangxiensis TaxID=1490290 RepID=A0A7W1WSM1_9BACL|nr:ParM/StbA family protein [Paenactinomyces guangxiensis]MBA4495086.1 ParM/StbA family protein [Paenactinomyces guangxiensis]MBH8592230.1 ParM/StbA family protein [Paenactinomyces guangxiensis]